MKKRRKEEKKKDRKRKKGEKEEKKKGRKKKGRKRKGKGEWLLAFASFASFTHPRAFIMPHHPRVT